MNNSFSYVYTHAVNRVVTILLTVCILAFDIADLYAQKGNELWEKELEQLLENEDAENTFSWEYLFDELNGLYEHPLDVNSASKEELISIPFLKEYQADSLISYIQNYGPMQSLGELWLVDGLSFDVCNLLRHFLTVETEKKTDKFTWENMWKYGKHEVTTRVDIPLYKRAGYNDYSDSILLRYPNRKYLGDPYHHSIRYGFSSLGKVYFGLVAEKDAGEPFFKQGNKGYDYYSFYLMLKNIGNLKSLIIGNYRLRFGQGLVMNTDFGFGKMMMLSSLGWGGRGIKRHFSVSEYNAFRGIAATYRWRKIDFSAFFSHHNQDGNINDQLFITSLKTDGLHRTPLEYSKKNNITNTVYGGNLTYRSGGFHGGLTAVYNVFNRELKPGNQYYKIFSPRGKNFFSVGADYFYNKGIFSCMGEIAFSKGGGLATINSVQLKLWEDYRFTLLQRFYSHDYCAIFGNSFSENSTLQNESGIYLGVDMNPWKGWKLTGYIDFCYFPWLKYQVSNSSYGGESMLQVSYRRNERWKTSLRYRCKIKERDYTAVDKRKYIVSHVMHRIRFQQDYSPVEAWQLSTLIDYNHLWFMEKSGDGYMLTQQFSWLPEKLPISLNMSCSYFNTDSYDNRISIYERSLPYTYSYPSYYYHGIHGSVLFRWVINKWLISHVKMAYTHFFNRSTISSGTELINASHREDIGIQLQIKL